MASGPFNVLVVDDDAGVRQSLRLCLDPDAGRVLGVGTASGAIEALERGTFDVVFLDLWLGAESGLQVIPELLRRQPNVGVIVITAYASFESAVEAMRLGAVDYLPKPFTPEQVRHAAKRVVTERQLRQRVSELTARVEASDGALLFDSRDAAFRTFLQTAQRAAATDSVVLLTGESGVGKTELARWIHDQSPRAKRPFVTVHCPVISGDLMTSALFGHRQGAFPGAQGDGVGKVEEAEGGTLFLDEVGELGADAQARLLRFLGDRTYERLGDTRERRADVRVLAATNRDLKALVAQERFREDLLFRLHVVTLHVPPLRERPEDVVPLARHFLGFQAQRLGRPGLRFSADAEQAITEHAWPGNLRALKNAVERAAILCPHLEVGPADLGLAAASLARRAPAIGDEASLEAIEREHLAQVVARAPTLEAAARVLGIDPTTLQRKRKKFGLA